MSPPNKLKPIAAVCMLIILMMAVWSITPAEAQIVINEVCPHNGLVATDEDGDHPDWFELFNNSNSAVGLGGYYIKDEKLNTWVFPAVSILPHHFLMVFASGKNRYGSTLHTSFKLTNSNGTLKLYEPSGSVLDEIQYPPLHTDHSYGCHPDGNRAAMGIFDIPTPAYTNPASGLYSSYIPEPEFSFPAGFYAGIQSLSLSCNDASAILYYTTDGSPPSAFSAIYESPIAIDSSTVIRATAYSTDPSRLPSHIVTNTYLIDQSTSLAVFCISTHPDSLWDWNRGIYVSGPYADTAYPYLGANYWMDWEIPAHVEFFESNHARTLAQDAGISIHGGSVSRTRPMKSLRLSARDVYGTPEFNHRFFREKNIDQFKDLVLRNSGGDYNKAHFRDESLHRLMLGQLDVDLLCYRPVAVYLNGHYWGVHNLRERFSKHYIHENYGYDENNVDLMEEDTIIIEGDFAAFNHMHAFVTNNDMSIAANFDSAAALIDVTSFADYFIAETFLSNIDWPDNNVKYWRARIPGSKWRYMLFDLDISLGNMGWAPASRDFLGELLGPYGDHNRHVQIFRSLLRNTGFRNYFINRYADLMNTVFSEGSMMRNMLEVKATLEPEMPKHFAKWGNSMAGWIWEINTAVIPYIGDRTGYSFQFVRNNFNLVKTIGLTLDVYPPAGGSIRINTIQPGLFPWTGTYFDGVPVTLTAIAGQGFTFAGWQTDAPGLNDASRNSQTLNLPADYTFTAVFSPYNREHNITVYPNPCNTMLHAAFFLDHDASGTLTIYNGRGEAVHATEYAEWTQGIHYFDFNTSDLVQGLYLLTLQTASETKAVTVAVMH